ncbi:MAG TPA: SBBP repeat-containing protein [Candidatus Cloacimonadota bacterium]|nr:SBBP repeat-containing protein [Candidatus Cloacimonadota bacterium]
MKATKYLVLFLILLWGAVVLEAQVPQWQWAVCAGGSSGVDASKSIAIDSQGNQYITGSFAGTVTFGSHTLTENGYRDVFVAKLDPSGNWLWAVHAGGVRTDYGYDIALDGAGNIWVTGSFVHEITFGSYTLTSGSNYSDIFIAKLDPDGNWLWAVMTGGIGDDETAAIAIDGEGKAWVTGSFAGTATFGNHTLTANNNSIFVAKLDPDGNWLWAVNIGGTKPYYIALDGAGNAYVAADNYVAKLDSTANWLWAAQTGNTIPSDIDVDGEGNAWVTGGFEGTATFGTHVLTVNGYVFDTRIYVAKVDPSGNWLWAVKAGGIGREWGKSIAVNDDGNAWVTGVFTNTGTFGSHTLTASGWDDIFVGKLDASGNWLWVVNAGGTSDGDEPRDIALDGVGNVYVTGVFEGTATFGSHTLTASGFKDIFVAELEHVTPLEDEISPQAVARLHNAYPNPLNRGGSALIKADIPERSSGILSIFNLRGQIVAQHKLGPGSQQVSFSGEGLPAGVYLYSLQCRDYKETRKLVLMK